MELSSDSTAWLSKTISELIKMKHECLKNANANAMKRKKKKENVDEFTCRCKSNQEEKEEEGKYWRLHLVECGLR